VFGRKLEIEKKEYKTHSAGGRGGDGERQRLRPLRDGGLELTVVGYRWLVGRTERRPFDTCRREETKKVWNVVHDGGGCCETASSIRVCRRIYPAHANPQEIDRELGLEMVDINFMVQLICFISIQDYIYTYKHNKDGDKSSSRL
jgi:hypothetical protein